ncbi:hypothetical protein TOPH_04506 [Tolypocladium ophioglossoides CBS 100239]|uniref:Uncharacterized protein n=1 Tax=Tolypocladium ophioglossoides (strain CBS 100239) TaxID=1163406 RepID=A0A0L0NAI4_TOLOC|nr:hypothetical protein TOPH_04506 [Tolypocladium ophioglossoides CBS 100239]
MQTPSDKLIKKSPSSRPPSAPPFSSCSHGLTVLGAVLPVGATSPSPAQFPDEPLASAARAREPCRSPSPSTISDLGRGGPDRPAARPGATTRHGEGQAQVAAVGGVILKNRRFEPECHHEARPANGETIGLQEESQDGEPPLSNAGLVFQVHAHDVEKLELANHVLLVEGFPGVVVAVVVVVIFHPRQNPTFRSRVCRVKHPGFLFEAELEVVTLEDGVRKCLADGHRERQSEGSGDAIRSVHVPTAFLLCGNAVQRRVGDAARELLPDACVLYGLVSVKHPSPRANCRGVSVRRQFGVDLIDVFCLDASLSAGRQHKDFVVLVPLNNVDSVDARTHDPEAAAGRRHAVIWVRDPEEVSACGNLLDAGKLLDGVRNAVVVDGVVLGQVQNDDYISASHVVRQSVPGHHGQSPLDRQRRKRVIV